MGLVKEMMIQMEEDRIRGYSVPDMGEKFLCTHHFSNPYLSGFIATNGVSGYCSYCGHEGTVIDLAVFVEYIGKRLAEYLEDINDAGLFLESMLYDDDDEEIPGLIRRCGYIAPADADFYESTEEAMVDFDLVPDSDSLYEDIASNLYLGDKIRRDPTSPLLSDELSFLWHQFSSLVRYRQRYTFFRSSLFQEDLRQSSNALSDILAELSGLVQLVERTLPMGSRLYRCRPAMPSDTIEGFNDVTAPPAKFAKANRLSPTGISMFYGSFDEDTPLAETLNYANTSQVIYRGAFKTKKDLSVIDLCRIPKIDFWMPSGWQEYSFLHDFHEEISKPIGKEDNPDIEYIPSQIFTEYLRHLCKASSGEPYDGIIYQSSLTKKENIVLFFDNKSSASILELCEPIKEVYSTPFPCEEKNNENPKDSL